MRRPRSSAARPRRSSATGASSSRRWRTCSSGSPWCCRRCRGGSGGGAGRRYGPHVRLPRMAGEIERRLLVNYRVDPAALSGLLPAPLRPQLVDGLAVAGICLIRLGGLRPRGFPSVLGVTTENAAHRVAVEWDEDGATRSGVFIPRRDTDSRATMLLGGRVFPGTHHFARFTVEETDERLDVAFRAVDGTIEVRVTAVVETSLTGSRLFADVDDASRFFEA